MRVHPRVVVALWFAALAGFAVMAAFAAAHDTFPADVWISHRLQDVHWSAFSDALDWTERVGGLPYLVVVWLAAAIAAFFLAGRWQAALIIVSMAARLTNTGLKEIVERPRPSPMLVETSQQPESYSFPSGHAQGAIVLYGLIFYLAAVYLGWRWLRLAVQAACVWITAVTGLQRIYFGEHWASDVIGGFYFGAIILAVLIAAERLSLFRSWRKASSGGDAL